MQKINCHNCTVSTCAGDLRGLRGAGGELDSLHFLCNAKIIFERLHSQVATILISWPPFQIAGVHFDNLVGLQL